MASWYRKIYPKIWKDEKFAQLTDSEKIVYFYCITCQANRIGLFNFSPALAAEDLRLDLGTFLKRFDNVCQTFQWGYDSVSRVLYIPTWWKYNQPENKNVIIGNLKDLEALPKTHLITVFCDNTKYLEGNHRQTFAQTLQERYTKVCLERLPKQEQEQQQLTSQDHNE